MYNIRVESNIGLVSMFLIFITTSSTHSMVLFLKEKYIAVGVFVFSFVPGI